MARSVDRAIVERGLDSGAAPDSSDGAAGRIGFAVGAAADGEELTLTIERSSDGAGACIRGLRLGRRAGELQHGVDIRSPSRASGGGCPGTEQPARPQGWLEVRVLRR